MPFDPTLPVNNSPIVSAELRNQFNALKELNDALAARVTALESQIANKANMPTQQPFDQSISNPPTQANVQSLADWNNELLSELNGTD